MLILNSRFLLLFDPDRVAMSIWQLIVYGLESSNQLSQLEPDYSAAY